jgi:uncharacterized protein
MVLVLCLGGDVLDDGRVGGMSTRLIVERNVQVPIRDGTVLRADVFRPQVEYPLPAILSRLPYDKDDLLMHLEITHPLHAVEAGYAVVLQDTRGRFRSDGVFYPFMYEGKDGYDTVEWVARQPWCDGSVGMVGASYIGATQWLAAAEQPPHLKALFPVVTASEYYEGWSYQGGAFQLGFLLYWSLIFASDTAQRLMAEARLSEEDVRRITLAVDDLRDGYYGELPLTDVSILRKVPVADYYFDWLTHEKNDDYWQSLAINRRYGQIQVPAFNVGGWYDLFLHGTIENFTRMQVEGGTEVARRGQRLLIGPWAHGNYSGEYPGQSFGVMASRDSIDLVGLQLRYFDQHLKGKPAVSDGEAPVRIFVMNQNQWRDENEWPLARTRYEPWYIHGSGYANSNGGELSPLRPSEEPSDVYLYDPQRPVPTVGGPTLLPGMRIGANSGPHDQRPAEHRDDVLVYTSSPLETPIEITGPLIFNLWAASSAVDTDFVVRLCDVWPDGRSLILAEGIIRARFRNGFEDPSPIAPEEVNAYQIDLVATSNLFQVGHSIRIVITSSSWPRFDVNCNTGNPLGTDNRQTMVSALQRVFHDTERPSHVILPIIPLR